MRLFPICKLIVVFVLTLHSAAVAYGQNVFSDCDVHGSARVERPEYRLNVYKNRYKFPRKSDFVAGISLRQLLESSSEHDFPIDKAIILTGYVYDVKMGGVETCNCKATDQDHRDTHIELTPDANHTTPEYRLIVEVTPRVRTLLAMKGEDWSTSELKERLIGRRVKVAGWLFYDEEHESQSVANRPNGARNWRASCWEVHPVTYIKTLD